MTQTFVESCVHFEVAHLSDLWFGDCHTRDSYLNTFVMKSARSGFWQEIHTTGHDMVSCLLTVNSNRSFICLTFIYGYDYTCVIAQADVSVS